MRTKTYSGGLILNKKSKIAVQDQSQKMALSLQNLMNKPLVFS